MLAHDTHQKAAKMPEIFTAFAKRSALRIVTLILSVVLACSCMPTVAQADVRADDIIAGQTASQSGISSADCPNINAQHACVVSEDGQVYFERGSQTQTQIASITKVMTALIALEYGNPTQTVISVSYDAAHIGESSADLRENDTLSLENALKALMITSGNDAAHAIAESMGGTIRDQLREAGQVDVPEAPYDAFVYAMNQKAQELGMANSLFANPHGLDFDEYAQAMYSTARDVVIMCQEAMKHELFRQIVSTPETTIDITRDGQPAQLQLNSTDILLGNYEGACGIKTGNTDLAGYCFAGAAQRDGKTLYAIVLKSESSESRFSDTTTLFDWVYNNEITYPLVHSEETTSYEMNGQTQSVPVLAYMSHTGWVDATFPVTITEPEASIEVFRLSGNVSQEFEFDAVSGDVQVGQKVGTVKFLQHNEVIAEQELIAAADARGPNLFESIGVWWDRLFRGFANEPTQAENTIVNTTPLIFGSGVNLDDI